MLRRLPIESSQPLVVFAGARVLLVVVALAVVLVVDVPDGGSMAVVLAAVALPWSLLVLAAAARDADAALNPLIWVGDFAVLVVLDTVTPEAYAAVRFLALFLIAVHSHFQGERRGVAIAGLGVAALIVTTAVGDEAPASGGLLAFYESLFALAALATAVVVGRLRTTESASRLRARGLSRRTLRSEGEVRRRVAESIHDGPVQELIALDMMLSAAEQAAASGDRARSRQLIEEGRELAARNVQALRDEILDLGPYAFEELSFATAVENCIPVWKRRYGFEVMATLEKIELPAEMAGNLFRITQEAVINAGRHAEAQAVSITLRRIDRELELRITDNGGGFTGEDPLGLAEPGHLGIASIRERAEMMDGRFELESSALGTKALVRVPLERD